MLPNLFGKRMGDSSETLVLVDIVSVLRLPSRLVLRVKGGYKEKESTRKSLDYLASKPKRTPTLGGET